LFSKWILSKPTGEVIVTGFGESEEIVLEKVVLEKRGQE